MDIKIERKGEKDDGRERERERERERGGGGWTVREREGGRERKRDRYGERGSEKSVLIKILNPHFKSSLGHFLNPFRFEHLTSMT